MNISPVMADFQASAGGGLVRRSAERAASIAAPKPVHRFGWFASLAFLCCVALYEGKAQLTILHSFGDGTVPNDGAIPMAGLIQAPDSNFYGTTSEQAGNLYHGNGTVFRLTVGGSVTIVHGFARGQHLDPFAALLYYNGELIGTTAGGGNLNNGTVFRTKLNGETVRWHEFTGTDGNDPEASVILGSDGNLYGTTFAGGSADAGTVFKLSPTLPHTLTVLYSFTFVQGDGANPLAALFLAQDGNYYGTTGFEGGPNGGGLIFQLTPAGKLTYIYQFPKNDIPNAPLIQDQAGNFYGTDVGGGTYGGGIVFKMTPSFKVSILHSFGNGSDGYSPSGVVFGPNGNLYGATTVGGSTNRGTIFELSPDGSTYTVLHNFNDGSIANDGQIPNGPLVVGSDNNLYGTTEVGGSQNVGTIFRISP
jgi:uncharacterized repeat protein (TIGR03803 family)